MFHVVLFQPEIPPNTGNVIRLCANTGSRLHLVHPLGFEWDDARVRRAGLDYHELTHVRHHDSWAACREALAASRWFAVDNPGATRYDQVRFRDGDAFVFGKETSGLPAEVLAEFASAQRIELPMRPDNRSLNLSNAVAVVVFEAWRQCGFAGATPAP
ncbi:MAG: tRNA (cytidine(34)-2'-O)-methyltransferase [Betaproteobacteria bacterium]|nr:tRNA (cytidine(34)-2'-O)-methyltransferase [Betaproteobacteria bacterium]